MLLRALAILVFIAGLCLGLSYWFGAEILAALGLAVQQAKILFARLATISAGGVASWLKAQGINFARVELGKRWFFKSILPLLIGAALQRRISITFRSFVRRVKFRYRTMQRWYKMQDRLMKIVLISIVVGATLALALSSMSLWLFVFSVQLPLWIIATIGAFWQVIWRSLQKLVFRTLAFMQLYRAWGLLRDRLPESYLRRVRRFNFRIARIVVKRRRMTVSQLHASKHSWGMRWALLQEYFRHKRPRIPSALEWRKARERRDSQTPAE